MNEWMNEFEATEENRNSQKQSVPVPFSLPQILYGQTWDRTRASVVTGHGKEFDSQHNQWLFPTPLIQRAPGDISLWKNRLGCEDDNSFPCTDGIKNAWSSASTSPYTFMAQG